MKRVIVIVLILITAQMASAAGSLSKSISPVESNIFGFDYSNESDSLRIERIESYLYGSKKSGNLSKRLENIQNDMGYVKPEDKTVLQKNDVNNQPKTADKQKNNAIDLKEDSSVEYPMVDKLENELFKTTYKNDNIYDRLNRLEEKVFNARSDEDLSVRVDKLAAVVNPKNIKRKNPEFRYSSSDMNNYYQNSGLEPVNNNSLPFQLAVLEQDILNSDYQSDNTAIRLERLEKKIFNRTFASDNDVTRLQRIMVAYDAKKNSYKYDNNKAMQNMAAISQFGGILLMILAMIL